MGIAGFYLWLQRHYRNCVEAVDTDDPQPPVYDNLYLDMNGLIHPCCHDTAPLPEPESEEEMFQRIYDQIDLLISVVRPRKCLVMAIDGVAPRSKMNQQRSRRFKAAEERREANEIASACADMIEQKYDLPRPPFRERWDHNVITPSTAFMDRVGQAIEWYILRKLNEDPLWRHLTVVFSDAHVPGEGEHKIMHYIRGLRGQPGYNPNTSHCIYGMDADLICLGLATHEPNFGILRNQLNEDFQPDHDKFCYFNLAKFRSHLRNDFGNIKEMDFERVIDDFVFLCFFVGNDFLPHLPLVSIKTKGIELMLDHYVRYFDNHYYLTKSGEVNYKRLGKFLKTFEQKKFDELALEYAGKIKAKERARSHVQERIEREQKNIEDALASLLPDKSNALVVSARLLSALSTIQKEQLRFVADKDPLTFDYADRGSRDEYYKCKFGWDPEDRKVFEPRIVQCCREYLRGMQWVMRYYTKGCPSWEWFYPYHYAPLLQDIAKNHNDIDVVMRESDPLHPVEQLLSVLPRESVAALPKELHAAVLDRNSVLAKFYPESLKVDITEALFSYQGTILLPFIRVDKLRKAITEVAVLDPDEGTSLVYLRQDTPAARIISHLLQDAESAAVSHALVRATPLAGRVGRYPHASPLNSRLECPDEGLAMCEPRYGGVIPNNRVLTFSYELSAHVGYNEQLLKGTREHLARLRSCPIEFKGGRGRRQKRPREDDTTNNDNDDDQTPKPPMTTTSSHNRTNRSEKRGPSPHSVRSHSATGTRRSTSPRKGPRGGSASRRDRDRERSSHHKRSLSPYSKHRHGEEPRATRGRRRE